MSNRFERSDTRIYFEESVPDIVGGNAELSEQETFHPRQKSGLLGFILDLQEAHRYVNNRRVAM
jgi:hypothetical protein